MGLVLAFLLGGGLASVPDGDLKAGIGQAVTGKAGRRARFRDLTERSVRKHSIEGVIECGVAAAVAASVLCKADDCPKLPSG